MTANTHLNNTTSIASWRKTHPNDRLDLFRADLTGAGLSGAALTGACLRGAHLREAGLPGADLPGADLTGADLEMAILPIMTVLGLISAKQFSGRDRIFKIYNL